MRPLRHALLTLGFLCVLPAAPFAQDLQDIIKRLPGPLPGLAQTAIAKLAESEWNKLPQSELGCVTQKLGDRGDSIQTLAQRGIFPFDRRVADLRSECSAGPLSPTSHAQSLAQTKYAVDGIALGSRVKFNGAAYREYKCTPSEQFDGFIWCQKTRSDKERRGAFTATYSILHTRDGRVSYVNRYQEPAFFSSTEADEDIQRYSRKIGESPRITNLRHQGGLPDGLIAVWGKTTLDPLDRDSLRILAEGKSPKKGLLIDLIGNFSRSAKDGLPIYRIGGGAGFVWAASFNQNGRGTLRFSAVDASAIVAPTVVEPVSPAQQNTKQAEQAPVKDDKSTVGQREEEENAKREAEARAAAEAKARAEQEKERKETQERAIAEAKQREEREAAIKKAEAERRAAEVQEKGLEYANKRETSWELFSKKNEMTDRIDNMVVSWQKNENGAGAEIIGKCENSDVLFTATVLDSDRKPTVEVPWNIRMPTSADLKLQETLYGRSTGLNPSMILPITFRFNDNAPTTRTRKSDGKFSNNVPLLLLRREHWGGNSGANAPERDRKIDLLTKSFLGIEDDVLPETWRVLAQFDTSKGSLLLRIPIYDSNVQKMIRSCS